MSNTISGISEKLGFDSSVCKHSLTLDFADIKIAVKTNSRQHVNQLEKYFAHILVANAEADVVIYAFEATPCDLDLAFEDWKREPGKTGRKDSFIDFDGVRLIRKVRTGMVFLQSESLALAVGPCIDNDNQVINFINSQYMTWLQQRNWLNCHAAALAFRGQGLALAGFSGGGKSTLMLTMLENDETQYITNDRLFVQRDEQMVSAKGIAKLPRINPGTILNNARLSSLIAADEQTKLRSLPPGDLWDLEDKYDVDIETLYGNGRIQPSASLKYLVILNWQRDSKAATVINKVDLTERHDLLAAVMKSPGPFYQYKHGNFYQAGTELEEFGYLDALAPVTVYEVIGGVDFASLSDQLFAVLVEGH